ncbi:hypothetical protein BJ944DRAFT_258378 [Cunninghamella echinulata]|nr:hypothetical protein BJ944DRAFT_258378 [Cunninghamella echinulata]
MSGITKTRPYDSKEYWEERFHKEDHYDWLFSWNSIKDYLLPYISIGGDHNSNPILHLGCGNSLLAFDMADSGYQHIVNIDYAEGVINKMETLTNEKKSPQYQQLKWIAADCLNDLESLPKIYPIEKYNIAIEKSLLDTIATGDDSCYSKQRQLAKQIGSVINSSGYWCSISFSDHRQAFDSWCLEKKIPLLVPQPNDKPNAPDIYYYLYIFKKL